MIEDEESPAPGMPPQARGSTRRWMGPSARSERGAGSVDRAGRPSIGNDAAITHADNMVGLAEVEADVIIDIIG